MTNLASMQLQTSELRVWFRNALETAVVDLTSHQRRQTSTLTKRKSELVTMQDRRLNAYLVGSVDDAGLKTKTAELNGETARIDESINALGHVDAGRGQSVLTVFDWSQKAADI